jgi:membrane associated rhomboid family serine protease
MNATTPISPKVTGATLGGALATITWIVIGKVWGGLSESEITALTGASGTIFACVFSYWFNDPLRRS